MSTRGVADIYRLSPLQKGLLFQTALDPGGGAYVEQSISTLAGALDPARLRTAWERTVARHPALRAGFHWREVAEPVQVVHREVVVPWREEDLSDLAPAAARARFEALVEADRRRGFELERPPLVRLLLARMPAAGGGAAWRFLWSYHHLLLDGWSVFRVLGEVFEQYRALAAGEAPRLAPTRPYVDYIAWLQGRDAAADEAFWRRELDGFRGPTPVPGARPAARGDAGASAEPAAADETLAVPASASAAIGAFARRAGVTAGTLVQAAWGLLLARHAGVEDVVFGSVVAGRPPHLQGSESMVGLFINTVPVRLAVPERERLLPWLAGVQERLVGTRAHETAALSDVRRWSGVAGGVPLFETLVAVENYPRDPGLLDRLPGVSVREVETIERTELPLNLAAVPGEPLLLRLTWDRRRFAAATPARLLGRLVHLLGEMAAAPDARLGELELLPPPERRRLAALAATPVAAPGAPAAEPESEPAPGAEPTSLVARVAAHAAARPDAPAVVEEDGATLSYGALAARAAALTAALEARGVVPEEPIALLLPRGAAAIAAWLGTLAAGAAVLPLDAAGPDARIVRILEAAGARRVVAAPEDAARLPERIDRLDPPSAGAPIPARALPAPAPAPEALAWVVFTSGSTGVPKGVAVAHGAADERIRRASALLGVAPGSRWLHVAPLAFDASVLEIFAVLASGGTVCPVSADEARSGRLAGLLRTRRVAGMTVVPSLLEELSEHDLPDLGVVMSGAEACPPATAARWAAGRRFWNAYGPTEGVIFATAHEGPGEAAAAGGPPIGRPLPGSTARVADRSLRPLPEETIGELLLGGPVLARGYLGHPAATAEAFVPDPWGERPGARLYRTGDLARRRSDGELELAGRRDLQLKVRGVRVEPGEVEAAAREHPRVVACAAGAFGPAGERRLALWVVPPAGEEPPAAPELRSFLAERLPEAMVPAAIAPLAELPRTAAGKLDRRALPEPTVEAGDGRAPAGRTEEVLARVWAEVLRVPAVAADDDFFALGGDSILALRIVARAAEEGVHLVPRQLFDHPTVAGLAAVAGTAAGPSAGGAEVAGEVPLLPVQRWFLGQGQPRPGHWTMSVALDWRERPAPERLAAALATLWRRHDALRLRFVAEAAAGEASAARWRARVRPAGEPMPVPAWVDLSRLPPAAAAAAWRRAGGRLQGSLDLGRGVLRAVVFAGAARAVDAGDAADAGEATDARGDRLLLVVHHLAVDAVSWGVLLDEIERAYRGEPLPPASAPAARWAERLDAWAASGEAARAGAAWTAPAEAPAPLPTAPGAGPDLEGGVERLAIALSAELTRSLLADAHEAYQTRVDELLVAALAEALAAWTGSRRVALHLEDHGRAGGEPPFDDLDLSRTVGWLTSIYPLYLDLADAGEPGAVVRAVKEAMRRLPLRGLPFGALAGRPGDDPEAARLAALPRPPVAFNYLGQVEGWMAAPSLFDVDPEPPGAPRAAENRRAHALEINAFVEGGRLRVDLGFGRRLERRAVERLAEAFERALEEIVAHCLDPEAGGYTPSDFPAADLDQEALDRLLSGLGGG